MASSLKLPTPAPDGGEEVDIGYLHSVLCQVGLPRRRFEGKEFMRRNGAAWMSVQAGRVDNGTRDVERGVPYGATPRLLLAWICTRVLRERSLELELGDNPRQMLLQLGVGAQPRRYEALREGLFDLAAARFQLGFAGRTLNAQPVQRLRVWGAGRPAAITIDLAFAADLRLHAVPLDSQALARLSGSALALDVYTWLAQRLCKLDGDLFLAWPRLHLQLGQEYQGARGSKDFSVQVRRALSSVLEVYPGARVLQRPGGLLLQPSDPPVERR